MRERRKAEGNRKNDHRWQSKNPEGDEQGGKDRRGVPPVAQPPGLSLPLEAGKRNKLILRQRDWPTASWPAGAKL